MFAWGLAILLWVLPLPARAREYRRFWQSQFPITQPGTTLRKILLAGMIGWGPASFAMILAEFWFSPYDAGFGYLALVMAIGGTLRMISWMAAPDLHYELATFQSSEPIPQRERKPAVWWLVLVIGIAWILMFDICTTHLARPAHYSPHCDYSAVLELLIFTALALNATWYLRALRINARNSNRFARNAGRLVRRLRQSLAHS